MQNKGWLAFQYPQPKRGHFLRHKNLKACDCGDRVERKELLISPRFQLPPVPPFFSNMPLCFGRRSLPQSNMTYIPEKF